MIEGPPRFGRSTSPLPRMEHCKKACRACAMSHWGLGGDLLLVLHTTVVVQTLRFVTWRCTPGGNPNMWVCYYVRSTSRAQICVCYILLMYIFGRITSTVSSFFTTFSITEVNSFGSAKSPMNSTLQQPGPPVGLLRGHSLPQKLRWSKLNFMEVWFRFDFPVNKAGDWLMFHVSFFLGGR